MIEEAQNIIPGGVQHNLAFNYPFPLVFTKAEGAYLYDIDGNRYYDFLQAGGPTVLGSNPVEVRSKVIDLLNDCGPSTGLFHEYEYKIGKKIADSFPCVDMFRMLGSGTEACMAAIRVARLATKNKNIIKMGGAYHGWSDQLAYGIRIPGSKWTQAHGVPRYIFKRTQEFFPNDLKDLERKLRRNQLHGGTAAVLIEPVGPESGTTPVDFDFNKGVEALCRKYGALLIFDEVVTGFRIGMSGAQGYFQVSPDLTIFGKVVGGGALAPLTCQTIADILGRTIETVEYPQNVGAMGAAITVGVGLKVMTSIDDASRYIRANASYQPNLAHQQIHDRNYKVFQNLYENNKKSFQILNKEKNL